MKYLLLFWTFLKIGALAFGGGYAMIAPLQDAVVFNGWMDAETFTKFLGVCESTPGPIAVNMATYIGSSQGGFLGAVLATLGVILPAFCFMLLLSTIFRSLQKKRLFKETLAGIRPAALGLILATGLWMVISGVLPQIQEFSVTTFDWKAGVMMGILFAIFPLYKKLTKKKLSAEALIGIAALLGIAFSAF